MLCTVEESHGYDFQDPENAEKWKGMFMNPLRKVLEQVHPALTAEESALAYVESLCLRLLGMLCAIPSPLTMQDVEERVAKTFPTPIDKWALNDARDTVDRTKKKKSILPTDRVHQMLQKEVLLYKIDSSVSIFIVAILEYISADILKLAGNYVKKISQKSGYFKITYQDIKTAMCADKVLMDMFYQDEEPPSISGGADGVTTAASSAQPTRTPSASRAARRGSLTYAELVRDLLADERQFLRELHLIIRVFKEEVERIVDRESRAVRLIFANIVDIYELTVTLLGNLEDAVEMSQDSPTPYIGSCFEELAEVEEFRAYVRYANIVTKQESRDALQNIVDDPELSEQLATAGHGFRLAVKYYLPKLLMAPIAHIFLYHNYVLALLQIAPTPEDRESFKQVECNLHPIKKLLIKALGNGPKMEAALRMATRARRQLAIEKTHELSRLIDNWDQKDIGQCCNEFIREDTLSKLGPGKRIAERRAYLFDGLLLLCKPVTSLVTVGGVVASGSAGGSQLKLKEKLHIRKLDVIDRNDTDEMKHCVELAPRVGGSVLLACGSCPEKKNWMSDLVMLNTKSMLDRTLDSILLDLERKHPLKLPSPEIYRFAVPDSLENIVLEERQNSGVPLIKGATLLKLVERLTYHIYADLAFMRTFLTTYRSFCAPSELLDLLIERFNIPDPSLVYDTPEKMDGVVITDMEKLSKNTAREDWKRYRKEFSQPVRFRVINVLRHWVDQHFYDFERDAALLERLRAFLESVDGKPMRKWVQSVLKTVQRKTQPPSETENSTTGVAHVFDRAPPPLQRHVEDDPERYGWHPLALHPLELARQLTLLEFDLYRTVKPSELVGAVWTKKDKEKTSPNLLRIIKHTTNFTRWMEKCVVEAENVEERVGVVSRLLETMLALRELNNFNGVLAVVAAMRSASVFRLKYTYQMISARLERALEECSELNSDHFRRYQERLRSINPPCVPFCGMYLTMILHIEDGNKDFLPGSELINFAKRRKVAEITGEIQQYQNQPYCLTVETKTRAFLENLNPFPGMDDTEIRDYLYNKSLEIEPRPPVKQLPKFPRKWPELSLKSPGIKPSRRHHTHNNQHADNTDDNISVSQLSPTSVCGASSVGGWDAASLGSTQTLASTVHGDNESQSSGAVGTEDHHTSSRAERPMLVSPRLLERTGTNTFSLFDRGFGFFDKSTSRLASTMSLNRHSSNVTSPSGLSTRDGESVSPRLPSHSITELSSRMLENFTSAAPPVSPRPFSTLGHPRITSHHHHDHDVPSDLSCEARHQRIVNDIIGNCMSSSGGGHGFCMNSTGGHGTVSMSRPPALSPRNPIVDACCFYGTNSAVVHHSFGDLMMGCGSMGGVKKNVSPRGAAPELTELRTSKPPALSPRGRLDVDRSTKPTPAEEPPAVLPRARPATPPPPPETVASTVVAEHNSPKVTAGDNGVVVGAGCVVPRMPMSPKRSPAPNPPPLSPHVNVPNSVQNYERHHGISAGAAFSFPSSNTKTNVSPAIPTSPTVVTHASVLGAPHTPPPLPPRRRRDSVTTPGHNQWGPVPPPRAPSPPGSPPPLPPRPPAQLLRPAHSTILQRRQHTGAACGASGTLGRSRDDSSGPLPRLPPKPPKP